MITITVMKHSDSGKSAFCKCTRNFNGFASEVGVGYLYKADDDTELPPVKTSMEYPGSVEFENMVDAETGELRTTKEGVALQRIVLK